MKIKTVLFTLSMPNSGSWNGRWSGAGEAYIVSRRLTATEAEKINGKNFYHNFGDGWGANIYCETSSGAAETKRRLKNSKGFCGYDWMIANIISHGNTKDKADL